MKRTILVVACVSLSLAVIISRSLAGPGTADAKGKEAVEKVLKAEKYTPTVAIEGPSNSVWLVACRVFGTKAIEQVIVNVTAKRLMSKWQCTSLSPKVGSEMTYPRSLWSIYSVKLRTKSAKRSDWGNGR